MLEGKGALVTGSSGSIGTAIANALAEAGANVMLNGYRNPEAIEVQRDRMIADYGTKVDYRIADLNEYSDIESMVADCETSLGSLDIVINNAGVRHTDKVQDFPNDAWEQAMRVNLSACFYTTRQAIPKMLERNWGRIVNISSIYGTLAVANRIDYVTTKAALMGMSRGVALELAETGITCNAVAPGWVLGTHSERVVNTHMEKTGQNFGEAEYDLMGIRQPTRRFVKPEQVAALVIFLCSDAASEITGATMPIDGAWSAKS